MLKEKIQRGEVTVISLETFLKSNFPHRPDNSDGGTAPWSLVNLHLLDALISTSSTSAPRTTLLPQIAAGGGPPPKTNRFDSAGCYDVSDLGSYLPPEEDPYGGLYPPTVGRNDAYESRFSGKRHGNPERRYHAAAGADYTNAAFVSSEETGAVMVTPTLMPQPQDRRSEGGGGGGWFSVPDARDLVAGLEKDLLRVLKK